MIKNPFGYCQYLFMRLYYPVVRYFLRLTVRGQENLAAVPPGAIFIANHNSKLDAFLIGAAVPASYHARVAAFRYPTFYIYMRQWYSPLLWLFGAYAIFPKAGPIEQVLRKTAAIVKRGRESVLLFPAGKVHQQVEAADARPGIAYLAQVLDPVIVPVRHDGCADLTAADFFRRRRSVTINFGKPFKYSDIVLPGVDRAAMAKVMMARVVDLQAAN